MTKLVIVSNRVALPNEMKPGGLAMAMQAALREVGGIWFGWSGRIGDRTGAEVHTQASGNVTYATIDLAKDDHADYYAGFANRTLWPLFHFRPSLVDFTRRTYDGYVRVNEAFAENLAGMIEPDDTVWVQDYHLIPLAALLRKRGVTARIGFFLHTPFPPSELLTMLPVHRELFEALTEYDLVGFQTDGHLRAFLDYLAYEAGAIVDDDAMRGDVLAARDRRETGARRAAGPGRIATVEIGGRVLRAGAFPISIDVESTAKLAREAVKKPACQRLRASLEDRKLVIGVDRLDYSKGLPERFKTFGELLTLHPEWARKVTLLQIAPTSRGEVAEYRKLRRELERIAGAINGKYAEPDWVPVRYVNKAYQHDTLTGFYRMARVGLVTPLRDGMNLVAKEYVACQDPDDPGVLVLSRFAGAAHEMRAALLVNPYDVEGCADCLRVALEMSREERIDRYRELMRVLGGNGIDDWRKGFLDCLDDPVPAARA